MQEFLDTGKLVHSGMLASAEWLSERVCCIAIVSIKGTILTFLPAALRHSGSAAHSNELPVWYLLFSSEVCCNAGEGSRGLHFAVVLTKQKGGGSKRLSAFAVYMNMTNLPRNVRESTCRGFTMPGTRFWWWVTRWALALLLSCQ